MQRSSSTETHDLVSVAKQLYNLLTNMITYGFDRRIHHNRLGISTTCEEWLVMVHRIFSCTITLTTVFNRDRDTGY